MKDSLTILELAFAERFPAFKRDGLRAISPRKAKKLAAKKRIQKQREAGQ